MRKNLGVGAVVIHCPLHKENRPRFRFVAQEHDSPITPIP
jgi:hypothetical protein